MGALNTNASKFGPIVVRLNQYSTKDMMPSIIFAQASAELGLAAQNRTVQEQKDEKYRGMFCEDWFVRTNPFGFVRNLTEDRRDPELILKVPFRNQKNTLWDIKTVLKTCTVKGDLNLYIPEANLEKDKRFHPPLCGYVGAVLQFPVGTQARGAYTRAIFEEGKFELLRNCSIHVIGWITLIEFQAKMFECPAGHDLNRGHGPIAVTALINNFGILLKDFTPFQMGREGVWPYKRK